MAAYPTLATDDASTRRPISGIQIDRAEDGTIRSRTLHTAIVYQIDLIHRGLSSSNRDLITAHYAANINTTFSYTWPDGSVAHTVVYAEAPFVEWRPGGWDVTVALVGTVT